ncbi:uncharacterized protein ACA1_184200 [Acanthamoeba castellanii str. Neff]|uniref:Uncharacterized protein n=1 Tax=Acanthamoeba castellanii (strain ATCC 30010 / Neff) TaxID=1257118 RepID=L8H7G1_ACACF|nr:uncharacterized protein ACA1_184200 [Acanthamoeba castellanii str. Neff]ELR21474.1 hypothetical protein ACA1_184200 [Acanthamoeba castellanii str. Neff]
MHHTSHLSIVVSLLIVAGLLNACAASFSPAHSLTGVWYRESVGGGSDDCVTTERLVQSGPNITLLAAPGSQTGWYASLFQGIGVGYGQVPDNGYPMCGETDIVVVVADANLLTVTYMPNPPNDYCPVGYGGAVVKYTRRLTPC